MRRRVTSAAFLGTGTAIVALVLVLHANSSGRSVPPPNAPPVLVNTCLITTDVNRLAAFYAQVLGIEPHKDGDDYFEFRTSRGVLALFSANAQEKYIPGSARPGENHSSILEFEVDDVDREYARLQNLVKTWVKEPSTQPWGTRSIYFRDPDGNLVDLFTVVKKSQASR
jgi:catechol 2,3-dioxygenase-like lactoylglutathione lyase family enzyme